MRDDRKSTPAVLDAKRQGAVAAQDKARILSTQEGAGYCM